MKRWWPGSYNETLSTTFSKNVRNDIQEEKAKEDIKNPKKGLKQANGTIFINAIKELGELNELYPSKKQDIKMDAKISNPYADFTYEELKKMIDED